MVINMTLDENDEITRSTDISNLPVGSYKYEDIFWVTKISRYGKFHTSMTLNFSRIEECLSFFLNNNIDRLDIKCDDKNSNIDFLRTLPRAKAIMLRGHVFDLSPLYTLRNLQGLILDEELTLHNKVDLTFFPFLSSFSYFSRRNKNIKFLAGSNYINNITIFGCLSHDLEIISSFKNLKRLSLIGGNIESLSFLHSFSKLQMLELSYAKKLTSIECGNVPSLRWLSLDNCRKIKDLSLMEKFTNLEGLMMSGNYSIPNINFLYKLNKLKLASFSVNIADGNMAPCKNIRSLYFMEKRHYSHKLSSFISTAAVPDIWGDGLDIIPTK